MKHVANMNELRNGAERVEVEWIDSNSVTGWHPETEALMDIERPDHMLCCSIGYVIHEDENKLVITNGFAAQGAGLRDVGDVMSIPKVAIRDTKYLRR